MFSILKTFLKIYLVPLCFWWPATSLWCRSNLFPPHLYIFQLTVFTSANSVFIYLHWWSTVSVHTVQSNQTVKICFYCSIVLIKPYYRGKLQPSSPVFAALLCFPPLKWSLCNISDWILACKSPTLNCVHTKSIWLAADGMSLHNVAWKVQFFQLHLHHLIWNCMLSRHLHWFST